jgi:hypothetical protein
MAKKGDWGFCGPTYTAESPVIDAEDAMNCYCERSESKGARVPIALLHTPGLKGLGAVGEGSMPGTFSVNGRTFFAASNLYELAADGSTTNRGSLGGVPSTPTQITANQTQLVILNNGSLFVLTLATNVLVAVNMAQFNGPVAQMDHCDGYIIATLQNSHTFQTSSLGDATTWSGLDIATISYFPDNIVSFKVDHRQPWFYSNKKAIGYYNGGAGFPVFIPYPGAELTDGAAAAFATVSADNTLFFLSQNEDGAMMAKRLTGLNSSERISTHAVELAWQKYKVWSDAVAYAFQENGHTFIHFYFPTANASWRYDASTGLWHKVGYYVPASGQYIAHRSMCHTFNFGMHIVGDWSTGKIYQMSSQIYTDDGNPIRGYRRTPTISKDNEFVYYDEIEIDCETGLGPQPALVDGDGQPRDPQLMLRWSNDGGRNWSNTYYLHCGLAGETKRRALKRMLGRGRKRIWEVAWTDPVPWRFADAYLRLEPEAD